MRRIVEGTPEERDVEVEVTFLPADHGGRIRVVFSGYRAQFYYDGRDWDAVHEYPDVEQVELGQHDGD
jgi:translation elongation factor EF-Tu-like GTPase